MFRLRVTSPCSVPWDAMERRVGGRHCATCDKAVHDLTAVTEIRARAVALLYGAHVMCGRIRPDASGDAIFRVEPTPRTESRARLLAAAVSLAAPMGCGGGTPANHDAPVAIVIPETPASAPSAAPSAAADIDTDHDGTPDSLDRCPNEPGPPENQGCPPRLVDVVSSGELTILELPHFAIQSVVLLPAARPILDEVGKVLQSNPQITLVHVIGHTDNTEANADKLSVARAKAAVDYLVKAGIDPSRLKAEGKGRAMPIAANDTVDGRAQNRRVEFRIEPPPPTNIP